MAGATLVFKSVEGINVVVVVVVGGLSTRTEKNGPCCCHYGILGQDIPIVPVVVDVRWPCCRFQFCFVVNCTVGDDKEGILSTNTQLLSYVVVVVGRIGWKPKDTDALGNETKRRRNSD
jgi:hypothetical protein